MKKKLNAQPKPQDTEKTIREQIITILEHRSLLGIVPWRTWNWLNYSPCWGPYILHFHDCIPLVFGACVYTKGTSIPTAVFLWRTHINYQGPHIAFLRHYVMPIWWHFISQTSSKVWKIEVSKEMVCGTNSLVEAIISRTGLMLFGIRGWFADLADHSLTQTPLPPNPLNRLINPLREVTNPIHLVNINQIRF